ncbi:hypothetical protein Vafri_10704 [Volvox africanus]|uniref:Mot1 central domain-containing protein n=1 Tax=Volvox africanus TaxID=51714 RepID=A0A8J4BAT6_9CHLO|nr:hypothetical protein Vafri_10704 [Volvox africanus]
MSAKPQSSSRLQKLLNLLDTGTSDATRKAAAKQLSEIARAHPDQLLSTIQKVHVYLYNKSWETRVAAGEALAFLADIFEHHTPDDLRWQALACGVSEEALNMAEGPQMPLSFANFSLQQVLERGTPLGASGGQEFDLVLEPGLTPKARLAAQREVLKKRLGLDRDMGLDADALFNDEDLEAAEEVCSGDTTTRYSQPHARGAATCSGGSQKAQQVAAQELLRSMDVEKLSARERNRLKRKAKALGRSDSLRPGEPIAATGQHQPGAAPGVGRHKVCSGIRTGPESPRDGDGSLGGSNGEDGAAVGTGGSTAAAAVAAVEVGDDEVQQVSEGGWPFQRLGDQIVVDSLDPVWEVRHGAVLALRELLRGHAAVAGVEAPLDGVPSGWAVPGGQGKRSLGAVSASQVAAARAANQRWLEDCVVHLLCVLALDRFGDYGSDQVTAPVRETAAQALGMALTTLDAISVRTVAAMLRELQGQNDWRVRYGGFCGLKYMLAARMDLAPDLLPEALPLLRRGLADPDDDVRAACADALVPVAGALGVVGTQAVAELRLQLWDLLPQLSDLSAATNSVMSLLAHLYGRGPGAAAATDELTALVPRLFPFVRHTLSTVRASVMQCLERMLAPPVPTAAVEEAVDPASAVAIPLPPPAWLQPLLPALVQLVFQNVMMEGEQRVLDASVRVWRLLVRCAAPATLCEAMAPEQFRALMALGSTQVR